jgi:Tfp pilus assembly protein PilO
MRERFRQFLDFARRNPVIVASLSIIVLLGSASYFLWQKQHGLNTEHEDARRTGENMMESLTGQARIASELSAATAAVDFIDRNLILEADLAENLGYFYQIEANARLRFSQLNQLSSQPQPEGSPFKAVPFALRATGPYRQVMRLLHELETGPRLARIRTFTFSRGEGEEESVTMDLTLDLLARP